MGYGGKLLRAESEVSRGKDGTLSGRKDGELVLQFGREETVWLHLEEKGVGFSRGLSVLRRTRIRFIWGIGVYRERHPENRPPRPLLGD